MLKAENMLNELSNSENDENKSVNDDFDFGEVLTYCKTDINSEKLIRGMDGTMKSFSFENA